MPYVTIQGRIVNFFRFGKYESNRPMNYKYNFFTLPPQKGIFLFLNT